MKIKIFYFISPDSFMGMWTLNRALRIEKGTSSCTKSIGGRDIDTLMIISVAP